MVRSVVVFLMLAGFVLVGCGADETQRPRVNAAGYKPLAGMTPEERATEVERQNTIYEKAFSWPAGKPGKRDLRADVGACNDERIADPRYADAHP